MVRLERHQSDRACGRNRPDGRAPYLAPDDGNAEDRTLVSVPLPRPIAPGETLVFSVDWASKLPRTVARTGWKDDFVMGAQWFPKLCKATPAGWHSRQFHAGTEFWADFGDYDVTLTLPKEMKGKVGASGVQKEEQEVGGNVRVRFVAEDVHDFAWTASPRYEVYRETFTHAGLSNVEMILLLQPDHRRVKERYFAATRAGLASYGTRYARTRTPRVTVVDPPWGSASGGMEYPTLFTGGRRGSRPRGRRAPRASPSTSSGTRSSTGSSPPTSSTRPTWTRGSTRTRRTAREEAFGDPVLVKRFFGLPVAFRSVVLPRPEFHNDRYQAWQLASRSDAPNVPSWSQLDGAAIRVNAYSKTALALASAERTLGPETWAKIMKTYATRFAFRHPTAADFRAVVKEIAGDAGDALFCAAWESADTFDYAVSKAETREVRPAVGWVGDGAERKWAGPAKPDPKAPKSWESVVVVRRMGEAVWPVDVELAFEGGHVVRQSWDGSERWIRYRCTGPKLLAARVDPDRKLLLDANLLNNGLKTEPDKRAAYLWASRLQVLGPERPRVLRPPRVRGGAPMRRDGLVALAVRGFALGARDVEGASPRPRAQRRPRLRGRASGRRRAPRDARPEPVGRRPPQVRRRDVLRPLHAPASRRPRRRREGGGPRDRRLALAARPASTAIAKLLPKGGAMTSLLAFGMLNLGARGAPRGGLRRALRRHEGAREPVGVRRRLREVRPVVARARRALVRARRRRLEVALRRDRPALRPDDFRYEWQAVLVMLLRLGLFLVAAGFARALAAFARASMGLAGRANLLRALGQAIGTILRRPGKSLGLEVLCGSAALAPLILWGLVAPTWDGADRSRFFLILAGQQLVVFFRIAARAAHLGAATAWLDRARDGAAPAPVEAAPPGFAA